MSFYNWKRFVSNNVFVCCCCQRDLFNQLLIHAAMKSENKHHQKLGRWGAAGISGFMLWGVFPPISVCFCMGICRKIVWGEIKSFIHWNTEIPTCFFCDCCPLRFSLTAFHLRTEHELLSCSYYVTDIHVCTACYTFIIDQLISACSLFESVFMSLRCLVLNFPRCLLAERDAVRPNSPLTRRLMQKALALQD